MRTYELIVVFDSSLEIEQIESELRKLQNLITRGEGLVRKWERWGKRRLAYEIRRRQYGYYVLVLAGMDFGQRLLYEGSRVLSGFALSPEAKAAIVSGDVVWLEKECGELTCAERDWLERRLEAEIW